MKKTIIIADDEPITRLDIYEILSEAGYEVVGEASNGFDVVELCRRFRPDLVLMDIQMPHLDGLKATKLIVDENLADSIVVLTAYSGFEFIEEAKAAGVTGYIVKPIEERSLLPEVEIAIAKGKEIKAIKEEVLKTKEDAEKRRTIDKAKEILMERYKITEEAAYKILRKTSMDKRCSIKEMAIIIIEKYKQY
ncbi:response regulator [Clostridium sp. PL3]|uniref:Response regulator n=1 Tax=Clostridium thailandense TaxID=2794346 RepID=A0A949TFN4_9CLOT|nr:response regulator [Clostridium thailandense]MBV7271305.1 response regulator [Clostridium thailandense]